jgi:hypothetical protein
MTISDALVILVVGGSALAASSEADERIWLDAKINGKPARMVFDSGAGTSALCRQTVQKLGLRIMPPQTNDFFSVAGGGAQNYSLTEECTLTVGDIAGPTSFMVLDLPAYIVSDFGGFIGWYTLSQTILRIDAAAGKVKFLDKVPGQANHWSRLSVVTNFDVLDLEIPHTDRTNGVVFVDTGFAGGLALPAPEWRRWKEAHPLVPLTLETIFSPSDGFYVFEEAWADKVSVGRIVMTDVPIEQAGRFAVERLGNQYEGTIGLAALKRLDLIIDGANGVAYWKPRRSRPAPYHHNRLGAVFVPTATHTNQAVARVTEGGPAFAAGVRNGDVLMQVDDVKVTSWNDGWLSRFGKPAGTKLKLALKRDGETFQTTAVLREIVGPRPAKVK